MSTLESMLFKCNYKVSDDFIVAKEQLEQMLMLYYLLAYAKNGMIYVSVVDITQKLKELEWAFYKTSENMYHWYTYYQLSYFEENATEEIIKKIINSNMLSQVKAYWNL